jgi:hypothetical protein
MAAVALLGSIGLMGCYNEAATPESVPISDTAAGAGGTGVGQHSTPGVTEAQTGTTTQRMGTGYAGPVTTPGPGASGR